MRKVAGAILVAAPLVGIIALGAYMVGWQVLIPVGAAFIALALIVAGSWLWDG